MCKCQVFEGGGDILPTETSHISRPEAKDNWRLACQVKVKEDMKIHVPDEVFSVQKWDCIVKSNTDVATFIREFVIELPEGENLNFEAGGYIQIDIPEYHGLTFNNFDIDIVQSPFSIFDRRLDSSGWMKRLTDRNIEIHVRSIFLQGLEEI